MDISDMRRGPAQTERDVLVILLPILIVLSSLLFFLVLFLVFTIIVRRRRGISLGDSDGPTDLSRDEFADGAGGFAGVEGRWLEEVDEETARAYQRAKDWQSQYPPNSQATDITLSQFLSIQEKGVSAWSFEPDYESTPSVLVHARTELTFLPDPLSACVVQSNLPLPKLNEVYYWEVKLFDLPATTNVAIGLTTKPYPPFRLPGHNRFSIAYHSNGDKSHNYPFTSTSFGPSLKEGDILGIGYRPRSGTVFFVRNGRKTEDAFVGLSKFNLFPSIGADGPCSVHVNLGQAGFNHIEANVKKWGLAPSQGTLAPPPAYGSERGSILLATGGSAQTQTQIPTTRRSPPPSIDETPGASTSFASSMAARRSMRSARRAAARGHPASHGSTSTPIQPSPLRTMSPGGGGHAATPGSTTIAEEDSFGGAAPATTRYISPTDIQYQEGQRQHAPEWPSDSDSDGSSDGDLGSSQELETAALIPSESSSPEQTLNPPTPHITDIHLQNLSSSGNSASPSSSSRRGHGHGRRQSASASANGTTTGTAQEPPEYTPVDPARYPHGLTISIPEDILAAALSDPIPGTNGAATTLSSSSPRRR